MKEYNVTGMSCAACSVRVERAVLAVDGVSSCSVNLLTNSMSVEGAEDSAIIAAVKAAGYGASPKGAAKSQGDDKDELDGAIREEKKKMIMRLCFSLAFLIPLMYITMGHLMWNAPLPSMLAASPFALALFEIVLSGAVLVMNQKFFVSGFKSAIKGAPNMDTLVALGSGVSFVWSLYLVFEMTIAPQAPYHEYLHDLYFESAAMILTLITVGKLLETLAKGRTTNAIKSLMKLTPDTATVIRDGKETEIPTGDIRVGDTFIVRAGESVAVDGRVTSGGGAADESALTGESLPQEKADGDSVFAGTTLLSGYLVCTATKVGEDTTMAEVIKLVSSAGASKAPIAKVADRVAGIFVPTVLAIAAITTLIWYFVNFSLGYALARGISVLVISCPCALGLATPVAIMVGSGIGARGGALFKTAASLEALGKVKKIVLDKTGTITYGRPKITDIIPISTDEGELLALAYSVENKSEHPLSAAITDYCEGAGISPLDTESFETLIGSGVSGVIGGEKIYGVSYKFASEKIGLSSETTKEYERLAAEGKTPLFFIKEDTLLGIIAVADTVKDDAKESIGALRSMGYRVIMLTGDNEKTAEAISKNVGTDEFIAGVLPSGKEEVIRSLQKDGAVAMVGDGINDAPALVSADVGLAIGSGTDIAIDSADVVLMGKNLSELVGAVRLSRATLRVIHQNLFWAFIYNVIGIPLAAGAFIALLGWELTPMFGAAAMSISSFTVVMNALSLNLKSIFPHKKAAQDKSTQKCDKTNNFTVTKGEKMEKIIKVEGMMCPHCEAHVKAALEKLEGVEAAAPSHKDGTATLTLSAPVDDEAIKNAVEGAGYKVL